MRKRSVAIGLFMPCATLAVRAFSLPAAAIELDMSAWSETFAGCQLQEVKSAEMAIKSYACGAAQGNAHLEADNTLPGFVEVVQGTDGPTPTVTRTVKIRAFKKSRKAPIESVLAAVRAASPGPYTATCTFEAALGDDDTGAQRFSLVPTGEAKVAWDASVGGGAAVNPPCGPLGVQFEGDLYFEVLPDDPTTVAFIDAGSEIQIFIPATLKGIRR